MLTRWYRTGVIYSVDVGLFQDGNDDGTGDFRGMMGRLDYLARLGVTTIWLHPIHPSPRRDGGYDITDYCGVHPRFGSLGDFEALLREAAERGSRVVLDLVVNHTSDQHPWFRSARADPDSAFRNWYVWSQTEPRFLRDLRESLSWHRGDSVMDARPVAATLRELPALPRHGQWATFLRNHDEVDLGRLTDSERQEVFAVFAPDASMRLYGRGIRRRLAPMLGGDRRRIELAYSLQLLRLQPPDERAEGQNRGAVPTTGTPDRRREA